MEKILDVKGIYKTFTRKGVVKNALMDVSFSMDEGECLGIVGESGCGKSTLAKIITHLEKQDHGKIFFKGKDMANVSRREQKALYQHVQMVFQMPVDSFNPRMKLGASIMEGMVNQGRSRQEARLRMSALLEQVDLSSSFADKYPHEVSGGECQRAAIARALAMNPDLLICDEVTSALDVTVQKQILELLKQLKSEKGMSYVFISHDIALVQQFCDRVLVMNQGQIVERGSVDDVIMNPKEEYTRNLIDAVLL